MDSTFHELGISQTLIETLNALHINKPTKIQQISIPQFLSEKNLIVHSPTGTGKTAAFAIPIIEKLLKEDQTAKPTLVIAPTRELVEQIKTTFSNIAKNKKLRIISLIGGVPAWKQIKKIKTNPQIIVGTMGRIMDLLERKAIHFSDLEHLIIDEVDLMLDRGFKKQIFNLLEQINSFKQIAVYSASYNQEAINIAKQITNNGIFIGSPEFNKDANTNNDKLIKQFVCYLFSDQKKQALYSLIKTAQVKSIIVFCDTKKLVDDLHVFLRKNELRTFALHGDKKQFIRERNLKIFANTKQPTILVTTDLIGRGIHVEAIDMVINYSACLNLEAYINRMGRTGRNNHKGTCVTFCTSQEKKVFLKMVEKITDNRIAECKQMEIKLIPLKNKAKTKKGGISLDCVQKIYANAKPYDRNKRVPLASDLFKSRMRQPEKAIQKQKIHDNDWQSNM